MLNLLSWRSIVGYSWNDCSEVVLVEESTGRHTAYVVNCGTQR